MNQIFRKPRDVGFLSKVSLLLVTAFLCLALIIISTGIKKHFVKELEINAKNLVFGYNHSLTKAVEASNVVSQLLSEKLEIVTGFISNYGQDLTSEDLRKIALMISVEEIDIYGDSGEIRLSNVDEYIGWIPPNDHPVRDFILSGATSHIDPVRNNTLTGHAVLYGYARMGDGQIVQVGINARVLQNLIQEFEVNDLLREMLTHNNVEYVKYISASRVILGSSSGEEIGNVLPENSQEETLYDAIGIGLFQSVQPKDYFDVYEPVYINGQNAGDLVIGISLENTRNAVKELNRSVTVVLIMLYLAALLMIHLLNSKNRKLSYLAYEDELTKLPNHKYLRRILRYELNKSPRDKIALVLIDIPRFTRVTIARGYEKGNVILRTIAKNIEALNIPGAELFRYSDEKFMMLIKNYDSKESLMGMMDALSSAIPMEDGENIEKRFRTLTFGALEVTEKYRRVGEALVDVMIAMDNVKEDGAKPYAFFDEAMEERIKRENLIDKELRTAIENPHEEIIYLAFQPIVDSRSEKVAAFEALARMNSKHYDFVPPLEFIEIAEKNGLMVPLGQIILEKALDFIKNSQDQGYSVRIAVNISAIQVLQENFVSMVKKALTKSGVKPSDLELEITETVFLSNYDLVNRKLGQLKELGVLIAIDDFGTGYSSFARLKELHVDTVKIDQYFIGRISTLSPKELITGDIINMVHKFGLKTVAEGIETQKERDYLRDAGCDFLQGYLYSRPLSEEKSFSYIKCHSIMDDNITIESGKAENGMLS